MRLKTLAELDEYKEVSCEITVTSRWGTYKTKVWDIDGNFYQGTVEYGSTEYRETDWDQKVDLVPVHIVEKLVEVWEKIK